jgi:hypothetical protein
MWQKNQTIMLTFSICIGISLSASYQPVFAEVDNTELTTPNNNISAGTLSNTTGIMKNTTGMIDDAFDALKDSFGTFFGGN